MAIAALAPVQEYLSTIWRPDREFIDGEVQERNLGEFDHADLQASLCTWLRIRRRPWRIRVVVEQRVQVSATRYRIPDIAVLSAERPIEQIITHPPLICIEILSPEDRLSRVRDRFADYVAMGVPNIWLFDPALREVWTYSSDALTKVSGDVLRAAGCEVEVVLAEIWADLE